MNTKLCIVAAFGLGVAQASAQKDVQKEVQLPERTTRHELPALPQSLYYLTEPKKTVADGVSRGLLVVLPGGDGSDQFLPFVAGALADCAPSTFCCVMLTAPKWGVAQKVVWPTASLAEAGMKYTTEEYVRAVVAEVQKTHEIDPAKTVLLGWSSSGPALYELLASGKPTAERAYIAMSVCKAKDSSVLAATKGMRIVLDQSRDDKVTPFVHAEKGRELLVASGATVRLIAHKGDHGWTDAPLPRLAEGLRWLLSNEPAPKVELVAVKSGKNLLQNGDFEDGINRWVVRDNSHRLGVRGDTERHDGKTSMRVTKSGAVPVDFVKQEFAVPGAGRLTVRAWIKTKGVVNAFVKVFLCDAAGKPISTEVDMQHLAGDLAWTMIEQTWDCTGAVKGELQIMMVGAGEVWIDTAEALYAK